VFLLTAERFTVDMRSRDECRQSSVKYETSPVWHCSDGKLVISVLAMITANSAWPSFRV